MRNTDRSVLIVGAGAVGLMAQPRAARLGAPALDQAQHGDQRGRTGHAAAVAELKSELSVFQH